MVNTKNLDEHELAMKPEIVEIEVGELSKEERVIWRKEPKKLRSATN
jgi:hypothetical protein